MPDSRIIQVDESKFETELGRLVSSKVEEILNAILDAEPDQAAGAARYERKTGRKEGLYRAGHYERSLIVKAGSMTVRVPKLKRGFVRVGRHPALPDARVERRGGAHGDALQWGCRPRVDDISQALWGERVPPQTLSDDLKRVYGGIDAWRNMPLERAFPYVFMDGIWPERSWGGGIENVSVLVAIGVGEDGRRETVGIAEGMKEDSASWESFIRSMLDCGLAGVRLVIGDRNPGLARAVGELLPRRPATNGAWSTSNATS